MTFMGFYFFIFKTKFGQKSSFVKTTFMSDLKKNYLKVVFCKDDFHVFLRENPFFK